VILMAAGLVTAPAWAGHHGSGYTGGMASWTRLTNYYSGNGGEFTIYSDGGPGLLLSNAWYASTTKAQDGRSESFQSFCVELREYIHDPMDVWVSTAWADGDNTPDWDSSNAHSPQSHAWKGGTGVGDDLNPATAYLYYHFAKGTLSNYDYTTPGRAGSAGTLQKAIWYSEGEISGLGTAEGGFTLTSTQQTQAQTWINASNWSDIGPVRILQMSGSTPDYQDQLYLIPLPGAVLLGVIGIGIVGAMKRRLS
jgi:hypothetical protein